MQINYDLFFQTILQVLSLIFGISISIIIFRIQTLETRNQNLEESILDHIFNVVKWSYPDWTQDVVDDICNNVITQRYYAFRIMNVVDEERLQFLAEDRDRQQIRLELSVMRHEIRKDRIINLRSIFKFLSLLLTIPISISLFMILVSNEINLVYLNFIVMETMGITIISLLLIIKLVIESMSTSKYYITS